MIELQDKQERGPTPAPSAPKAHTENTSLGQTYKKNTAARRELSMRSSPAKAESSSRSMAVRVSEPEKNPRGLARNRPKGYNCLTGKLENGTAAKPMASLPVQTWPTIPWVLLLEKRGSKTNDGRAFSLAFVARLRLKASTVHGISLTLIGNCSPHSYRQLCISPIFKCVRLDIGPPAIFDGPEAQKLIKRLFKQI